VQQIYLSMAAKAYKRSTRGNIGDIPQEIRWTCRCGISQQKIKQTRRSCIKQTDVDIQHENELEKYHA
jgi:hypothetical protein